MTFVNRRIVQKVNIIDHRAQVPRATSKRRPTRRVTRRATCKGGLVLARFAHTRALIVCRRMRWTSLFVRFFLVQVYCTCFSCTQCTHTENANVQRFLKASHIYRATRFSYFLTTAPHRETRAVSVLHLLHGSVSIARWSSTRRRLRRLKAESENREK